MTAFGSALAAFVIWGLVSELSRSWPILVAGLLFTVTPVAIYAGILPCGRRGVLRSAVLFAGTALSIPAVPVSFLLLNRETDWYLPVQMTGLVNGEVRSMRFFQATTDKAVVMLPAPADPDSYLIVSPGAGHRPAEFKGAIYACTSVVSTFLFAATSPYWQTCAAPLESSDVRFAEGTIEFTSRWGNRLTLQWKPGPLGLPLPSSDTPR